MATLSEVLRQQVFLRAHQRCEYCQSGAALRLDDEHIVENRVPLGFIWLASTTETLAPSEE